MKVDLGCGKSKREGYVGVDIVGNEQEFPDDVDYVVDVRSGLPFVNGEVEGIFCSHFLEHLTDSEGLAVLRECWRVLQNGGVLELITPDFIWCLQRFLALPEETPDPKDQIMGSRWGYAHATIFGHQAHPGEYHKTGFSREKAVAICEQAGFEVQGCVPIWTHNQRCILIKAVKNG